MITKSLIDKNAECHNKIIEYLEFNYWYGVLWFAHFGVHFRIFINTSNTRKCKIYKAIYEQYYDVVGYDDILVASFDIKDDENRSMEVWTKMMRKFKSLETLKKGGNDGLGNIVHTTACHLTGYDPYGTGNLTGIFGSADTVDECVKYMKKHHPGVKYQINFNAMKKFHRRKDTQVVITESWF